MRLLAVCDLAVDTGFATVSRAVLSRLHKDYGYEIHVIGINATGDPHPDQKFARIYPAAIGGDYFGIGRIDKTVKRVNPDVVWLFNDIQVVKDYLTRESLKEVPVVTYMPVDSIDIAPRMLEQLTAKNVTTVTYSEFGRTEMYRSRPDLKVEVIGHGVDTEIFKPLTEMSKWELRQKMNFARAGVKDDTVIYITVNRNSIRKNIPALLRSYVKVREVVPNSRLFLHMVFQDQSGWNIDDLLEMYGLTDCIMTGMVPDEYGQWVRWTNPGQGLPIEFLVKLYQISDVYITSTSGEGWGLGILESLACGLPVIAPRNSVIPEILKNRGFLAQISGYFTFASGARFGLVNENDLSRLMIRMAKEPRLREMYTQAGLEYAREQSWDKITKQWDSLFCSVKGT